ncbi:MULTISPECIES: hypothetical protein [unclassified Halomonas]|uniref:hypothetical protein n=1 Tax=unclassified Halomonas TaxID=2609666 RepID=UPI0013F4C431|nr:MULTISPECIES: hypothetical protein [unclassified Halomonas]MBT2786637.1 hypothetical protein [Halomonas sp. ISL-106]MBT2797659.1 hypothetical protein [Halomonas sp. ISL-104]
MPPPLLPPLLWLLPLWPVGGVVPADDLSLVGFDEAAFEDGELEADPLEEEGLGCAELGEADAGLVALSLGVPGALALLVVVSVGLAVLVALLAAVELAAGEPFPRRRDRLFLASL